MEMSKPVWVSLERLGRRKCIFCGSITSWGIGVRFAGKVVKKLGVCLNCWERLE